MKFFRHLDSPDPERAAERTTRDGFRVRNYGSYSLARPIDWAADPHDDANWRYQLNAMYPLGPVFQTLAEAPDAERRRFARRVFLDWIEFNLHRDRPNPFKWNDMATGIRASYLAQLVAHERTAGDIPADDLAQLIDAGRLHLRKLADPELFTDNNHGIFQMVGIAALCEVEAYAQCESAVPYARERYRHLFGGQVNSEGMHLEHSPEYHLLGVNVFTRIEATGLLALSPEHRKQLERAKENLQWLLHPDGGFAELGDTESRNAAGAQNHHPQARWLRSRGGAGQPPEFGAKAFPDAGYAFARMPIGVGSSYLAFSVAHHSRVHKHADTFSFEWSDRGHRVLVDSGKWGYDPGPEREYVTRQRAHNVVSLKGWTYSPGDVPPVLPRVTASTDNALAVLHARGRHAPGGWFDPSQERWLAMNPGEWLIVADDVSSYWPREAVQWFHLPPEADVGREGAGFSVRFPWTEDVLHIFPLGDVTGAEARRGEKGEKGEKGEEWSGWYSPRYRELVPTWQVGFRSWGFRHQFATVFRWVEPDAETPDAPGSPWRTSAGAKFCWQEGDRVEGVRLAAANEEWDVSDCE